MKCPKCNFEQPDDQYCAQCGVDIISYHAPKQKFSLQISLQKHFLTEIFLVFLVFIAFIGFAGNLFISNSKSSHLNDQKTKMSPIRLNSSHGNVKEKTQTNQDSLLSDDPEQIASSSTDKNLEKEDSKKSPSSSSPGLGSGLGSGSASESVSSKNSSTHKSLAKNKNSGRSVSSVTSSLEKPPITFEVIYTEMDNASLQTMIEEARQGGKFSDYSDHAVGILPFLNNKDLIYGMTRILDTNPKELDSTKTVQWVDAVNSPKDNSLIGLFFQIELNKNLDSKKRESYTGTLDISRNWPDDSDGNGATPFPPISFDLDKNSVLFIAGIIPRKTSSDLEEAFLSSRIFKILKRDSDFMSRKTELVIFIRPLEK